MNHIPVTAQTGALRNLPVPGLYLNRIVEPSQGECDRVKETIVGFGYPFVNGVRGQMTVVANRGRMMGAFLPGIQVILHHMAIGTGLRIIAQVAPPFSITKGERANTNKKPEHSGEQQDPKAHAATESPRFIGI